MDYRSLLQLAMMAINGCSLIAFLTLVIQSDGACKSALFKLYKDRYLANHVIKSIRAMSQVECSMMCSGEDECESWNMYEAVPGRNCELNNATVKTESANHVLQKRNGATFGHRITLLRTKNKTAVDPGLKNISYVFTNLGKEGREGPANASGYLGTTLEGQVTLKAGIQMWQVPYTGTYIIESRGAAGANATCYKRCGSARTWHRGGLGAKISGKFWLTHGTLLKILVGQRGMMGINSCYGYEVPIDSDIVGAGAGGGSFVTYVNNTPLIIAGGGGGGGSGCGIGCDVVAGKFDGDPGQLGVLGSRCNSTVGNGGMLCSNEKGYTIYGGSGAGLLSNGSSRARSWLPARCFVDGGRGGTAIQYGCDGGFGGGGFGYAHGGGGGGGGYTGGGVWANSTYGIAGGGGSVNHGFDKQSGYGDALEHGLVKIVFLG